MRKTFTYLSLMMAFLLIGTTSAWAQEFTGRVEQYPKSDYTTSDYVFKLSDIAAALGTDTTTLVASLDEWAAGNDTINEYVSLIQPDGTKSVNYTQGGAGCFWLTTAGAVATWGVDATWYNLIAWDTATDAFAFSLGQYPDSLTAGTSTNATIVLAYNEKEVTFKLGIDVIALPELELMDDTLDISAIEVIATCDIPVTQYPRSAYDGDEFSADIADALAKLGADVEVLSLNMAGATYAQYMEYDSLKSYYVPVEKIHNTSTANAPGWWYSALYDESVGDYSNTLYTTAWDSEINRLYLEYISIDPETNTLTGSIGQYPGNLVVGDVVTATFYVVYKGKAIKVNVNLTIEEMPTTDFESMEKVGEMIVPVAQYPRNSYASDGIEIDINAISEALGCAPSEWLMQSLAGENTLSSNSTANNGGYWFNTDGYIAAYGSSSSIFIEPANDSILNVGQYPNALSVGYKQTYKLYFTFGTKYYLVQVDFEVIAKPDATLGTIVATEGYQVYIKPTANYYDEGNYTDVGYENIVKLIGEEPASGYILYGLTAPVAATDSTDAIPSKVSDAYSCDPNPGFWMNIGDDGNAYVGTWGTNAFGMTWGELGDGIIKWYQIPSQRVAGDSYAATFYINNPETEKTIQYDFIVTYTDEEIVPTVEVGKEDVTLVIAGMDPVYTPVSLQTAADSLGVTDPALFGSATVKVLKTSTQYTDSYYSEIDGWYLGADGCCIDPESDASATAPANLGFEWGYDSVDEFQFFTFTYGAAPADGEIIRTKVALEYDSKVYIFNISLMNEATATGIQAVENNAKANGNVYDLSGRVVAKDVKSLNGLANGIYIFNGKKYIVK